MIAGIGGILFSLGLFLASWVQSLPMLYLTWGLLVGVGCGFGYLVPITVSSKWFPNHPSEFEFPQRFRTRLSAEGVELLTMDANDVTEIAIPAEDGADDLVKLREVHVIRNREKADHHGAHLAENNRS